MKSSLYFLAIMVLASAAFGSYGLCQDTWNVELVGKAFYDGHLRRYDVYQDHMFVSTFNTDLDKDIFTVVDITDRQHPQRLGVVQEYDSLIDFLVVDTLLYVTLTPSSVAIYDINDPSSPVELAIVDGDRGFGYDLSRLNDHVFSMLERRLAITDISDRLDPVLISSIDTGIRVLMDYDIYGNYLVVTENYNNVPINFFEIFDISDLENPVSIFSTQLNVENGWMRVVIIENYAYLHNFDYGILIYDLTDIDEPAYMGRVFDDTRITEAVTYGQFLLASTAAGAMLTIEVSDPLNPVITNDDFDVFASRMLKIRGSELYYTVAWNVVGFASILDPESPELEGTYFTGPVDSGPAKWGNYLYYGIDYAGLRAVDISDPSDPIPGFYAPHGGASHFSAVKDGYLYFTDHYDTVFVYSLADPANPVVVSEILTGSLIHRVNISGDYLYIACDREGFMIVDISDPQNPVEVLYYPSPTNHNDYRAVVGNGDYVYTAESDSGIVIYDVADPSNPVKLGAYRDVALPFSLFYENDILYVADGALFILDVSDPELPTLISGPLDRARDVVVQNQLAYAAAFDHGVNIFDVSDPYSPLQVAAYQDSGLCSDIYVENDTAYATASGGGLWILRYDETTGIEEITEAPEEIELIKNHPNPFNASTTINYSLPGEGNVSISIYSLLGQRVATLYEGQQESGEHTITWDASAFPSGVYFARLVAGGRSETVKMVLLK